MRFKRDSKGATLATVSRGGTTYRQNTTQIGKSSRAASGKRRNGATRTTLQIHKPVRAPSLMEKMTAVTLPHNPVMGAMTLIDVFDVVYLRVLVEELSKHLKGLEA